MLPNYSLASIETQATSSNKENKMATGDNRRTKKMKRKKSQKAKKLRLKKRAEAAKKKK